MTWEFKFMRWGNGWWSSRLLDHVLPWVTHLGSHFAVILFILLSWITTKQLKVLFGLLLLYAIQSFTIYLLKFIIRRQRPLPREEMKSKVSKGPGEILDPSFPSAHTTFSFMMATVLAFWFPRYQVIFFIVAGFIGWTRIYLGLHYITDIIAGPLLGYGITKLFLNYFPLLCGRAK
jgi:undecaprenyl-diphosphatase